MDELKLFAQLRPHEQLSDTDLAGLRAELFSEREQSPRAHRLVTEVDEEQLQPIGNKFQRSHGGRQPRRARLLVAAVIVAGLGVGGLVMIAERGSNRGPQTSTPATRPQTSSPTSSPNGAPSDLMGTSPLQKLVEPFIPEGFVVMYASGPPSTAVAYNGDGIRLEVTVDLDQAQSVRGQIDQEQLVDSTNGQISSDGTMLLSTAGDLIQATFSFAGCPCELEILDELRPLSSGIVVGIADAVTEGERSTLRDLDPPTMGTSELRAAAAQALTVWPDMGLTGGRIVDPWDFNTTISTDDALDSTSTVTLEAIRAEDNHLTDGVSQTSDRTAVATKWVNGWQLVAGSIRPDSIDAAGLSELEALLTELTPLFADWTNSTPSDTGCATREVVKGDSIDSIAERYGTTIEALRAVNADLDATTRIGANVQIPCPATLAMPSSDQNGLDTFQRSLTPFGFEEFNTIRFATDGFVYVVSGGSDTQGGSVIVERFNRDTRASDRVAQASIPDCRGPIEIVGPVKDPAAIDIRCDPTDQRSTMDVFNSQTQPFAN